MEEIKDLKLKPENLWGKDCFCPDVDEIDVLDNVHLLCHGTNPVITKKAKKTRSKKNA